MTNTIAFFEYSTEEDFSYELEFVSGLTLTGRALEVQIKDRATNAMRTTLTLGSGITLENPTTISTAVAKATMVANWPKGEYSADLVDITGGGHSRLMAVRFNYDDPGKLVYGVRDRKAFINWSPNKAYVSATGAIGPKGPQGDPGYPGADGVDGDKGWSPILAVVADGARYVLQVADWTGGSGAEPSSGQYIGASGLVTDIADAVSIRGPAGPAGSVTDGDKGDIVVSGSGAAWSIDPTYTALLMPKVGGVFTGDVWISSTAATLLFRDTDATATKQTFRAVSNGAAWYLQSVNDGNTVWFRDHIVVAHDGGVTLRGNGGSIVLDGTGYSAGDFTIGAKSWPQLNLNKLASGQGAVLGGMTNGVLRWQMRLGSDHAEAGSSVGSDWDLLRFDDVGTYQGIVISAKRATGNVHFSNDLVVGGSASSIGGFVASTATASFGYATIRPYALANTSGFLELGANGIRLAYIGTGSSGGRQQFVAENGCLGFNFAQRPQSIGNDIWDAGNLPTTSFGRGLANVADAAAGRSTLGAEPLTQSASGVGQFVTLFGGGGANVTLPSGGTWLWWIQPFAAGTGNLSGAPTCGVSAGGTVVTTAAVTGFAKRIA